MPQNNYENNLDSWNNHLLYFHDIIGPEIEHNLLILSCNYFFISTTVKLDFSVSSQQSPNLVLTKLNVIAFSGLEVALSHEVRKNFRKKVCHR